MNQLQSLEHRWSADVSRHFRQWDNIADSFNPLLVLLLLGVALWLSRESHARAWRFLGHSVLALIVTLVAAKFLQRFHWLEVRGIKGHFPSTHMAFSASLATSLWATNRRWIVLAPIIVAYAWLMTALRYHTWAHIAGGALLAFVVTWATHKALRQGKETSRHRTSTRTAAGTRKPRRSTARTR